MRLVKSKSIVIQDSSTPDQACPLGFTGLRRRLSKEFNQIADWRQAKKIDITLHDALMSGFACMHFQDPSLLQFQKRMQEEQHRNNLNTMFDVETIPKETQMRELIDRVDSEVSI